ncbi:MAG: ATP-binding protein [bacterium]
MKKARKNRRPLLVEIEDLRIRLDEAEATLAAIRRGEVDALVVQGPEGEQVYTLKGAEGPYRVILETMSEGAVTATAGGTVLYCNQRFAEMLGKPLQSVLGQSLHEFVTPEEAPGLERALEEAGRGPSRNELSLQGPSGTAVPVQVSVAPLSTHGIEAICMVVTDLSEPRRSQEALRQSEERLRQLSANLLRAQDQERKLVAQDIHDGVGQLLAAIKYRVEEALRSMTGLPEEKIRPVAALVPMLQSAMQDVRRIQHALRPSLLDDLGLLKAIEWFCREFQTTYSRVRVMQEIQAAEQDVPEPLKTTIFRILQEALNNTAKHSAASTVWISLQSSNGDLDLVIRDNGSGFELGRYRAAKTLGRGLGLSSMMERAQLAGGTLSIESAPNKGTTVRASWPRQSLLDLASGGKPPERVLPTNRSAR